MEEEKNNKREKKTKIILYLLLSSLIIFRFLFLLILFAYFTYLPFIDKISNPLPNDTQSPEEIRKYTDDEELFSFTLPEGWEKTEDGTTYDFISEKKVAFESSTYGCKIVYGIINKDLLLAKPYSFDIPYEKTVLSLSVIFVPTKEEAEYSDLSSLAGIAIINDINTIAVPNFPYLSSKYGLVVLTENDTSLRHECVDEFDQILSEREVKYEKVTLSNKSNGLLYLEYNDDSSLQFLFLDNDNLREQAITDNLYSKELMNYTSSFYAQLVNSDIYFLHESVEDSIINKFDISTGKITKIDLIYEKEKPVHSFFVQENTLFYVSGIYCRYYGWEDCNLDLYSFDLLTKETQLLATGLVSRDILGVDSTKENLILESFDGEAAGTWGIKEQYNFESKQVTTLSEYSYFYLPEDLNDMDKSELEQNEVDAAKEQEESDSVIEHLNVPYIIFSQGQISFPSAYDYNPYLIDIRVNTTQSQINW